MAAAQGARHLYVHVPFCRSRCAYCDFASEELTPEESGAAGRIAGSETERIAHYLDALERELQDRRSLLGVPLRTAYIGGGTPTVLPRQDLRDLVAACAALLASGGELTVEANPGTVDREYLEALLDSGATRLSLGVQSFSGAGRRALGRACTGDEIEDALEAVRTTEWPTWSLDLIFGIPGQDEQEVWADLRRAAEIRPPHVSLYDLTYTDRYDAFVRETLGPESRVDAETRAEELYAEAVALLEDEGYRRYEVSNFALPGHECGHNLGYWRGADYVGIGASAVSTVAGERSTNPRQVAEYLRGGEPEREAISPRLKRVERAMLGLRTAEGVGRDEVAGALDEAAVSALIRGGYMQERCGRLFLYPRGLDLGNVVLAAVLRIPETEPGSATFV